MELIRLARTPLNGLEQDFTILAGILSTPVDFLESIFDKILVISESVSGQNENIWLFGGNCLQGFAIKPSKIDVVEINKLSISSYFTLHVQQ